jgi:hypothetical protein
MNLFIWEWVKCDDGSTKVKILKENDKQKDWEKVKTLKKKDILRIRNCEKFTDKEVETPNVQKREITIESKLRSSNERKEIIDSFYSEKF